MASLESLAWQEKFPDEVKALIGLDWALPSSYEDLKEKGLKQSFFFLVQVSPLLS